MVAEQFNNSGNEVVMTFQDKIARSLYRMQNKLFDTHVHITGTQVDTIMLEIVEDRYHNESIDIVQYFDITCVLDFPNDEIPVSLSSTDSNMDSTSSNVLHLYDILPITCFFKNSDLAKLNVIKGSVILYKLKLIDGNFQVIPLQITDTVAKGNPSSAILWQEYTVAPVVNYELTNNSDYIRIVEEFRLKNTF